MGILASLCRASPGITRLGDSDFFLRKAIGWALRDYARTDPAWVRSFAETRELSPLS
ncbi:MAG TPA: DNA alkylation repair protein, partial [Streptosporangiaceae bacterium]|nr:DNA alkylation repair protein [Streptosporangiaceae bacterium]